MHLNATKSESLKTGSDPRDSAVAKLQAGQLEHGYLRYWAKELGVADLAERLLSEVEA